MKISCDVVQDLLPLYIEEIASRESVKLVEEHLQKCEDCSAQYEQMKKETAQKQKSDGERLALQKVKKDVRKRKIKAILLTISVIGFAMLLVFVQLSKPIYAGYRIGLTKTLMYADSDMDVKIEEMYVPEKYPALFMPEELPDMKWVRRYYAGTRAVDKKDAHIYVEFADEVTSYRTYTYVDSRMRTVMVVEGWTSIWDRLWGKKGQTMLVSTPKERVDLVQYVDRTHKNFTYMLYGTTAYPGQVPDGFKGNNTLGVIGVIALAAAGVTGILWLVLRGTKKRKAARVAFKVFLLPVAYLLGHLCIKGFGYVSADLSRELPMIIAAGALIYGILVFGGSVLRDRIRDKDILECEESE